MRISIITVCYNSEATIRKTLESVAGQDFPDIEHIVIDGKSRDNTVSIARDFAHVARIISEKDGGLYHAMNKGIELASGDIIGFLHSDDFYTGPGVLSFVAAAFNSRKTSCVYGDLQYVDRYDTGKVIRTWKAGNFTHRDFLYGWMPPHPAFFVKREVYQQVGLFNTSLKSSSDYEMMLRILYKNRLSAHYLSQTLVKMRAGGVSNNSIRSRFRANREDAKAWKLIDKKPHFLTIYLKPLRKIPQYLNK